MTLYFSVAEPDGKPSEGCFILITTHAYSQVCYVIGAMHHLCQKNLAASFHTVSIFLSFCLGRKLRGVLAFHKNFEKDHFLFYKMHFSKN